MKNLFLLFSIVLIFSSCKEPSKKVMFMGKAQGTYYSVTYYDHTGRNFQNEIDSILDDFNITASIYDSTSIISRINRNEENVELDKHFTDNFKLAKEIHLSSNGAFDITVGPLIKQWGFYFKSKISMDSLLVYHGEIDSILHFVGSGLIDIVDGKIIKKDPRIRLDFNAIAQGYSVGILGDFLASKGVDNYIIDIGGEVLAKGTKPKGEWWKVGIDKPVDNTLEREIQVKIKVKDKAIATSGSYRKFYLKDGLRYSHTVDPKTGYPVTHNLLSATVLADDCAVADAWATAFMVMGIEKTKKILESHTELEVFLIYDENGDMKTFASDGFKELIVE